MKIIDKFLMENSEKIYYIKRKLKVNKRKKDFIKSKREIKEKRNNIKNNLRHSRIIFFIKFYVFWFVFCDFQFYFFFSYIIINKFLNNYLKFKSSIY